MSAGSLALACLLLVPGQPSVEASYVNTRGLRIDIEIDPARRREISQVILYVSRDKGKTWERAAGEAPDKEFFAYQAPADGEYWFLIAAVDLKGKQDPENVYRAEPHQKTIIDTAHKPSLRISAQRRGDELVVAWQAWSEVLAPVEKSLDLKYCTLDSNSPIWLPISVVPGATGEARAQLSGPAPVKVRMQFRDVAGNLAHAEADVPGMAGTTQAAKSSPLGSLPIAMPTPSATGVPDAPGKAQDIAPPPAPPTRVAEAASGSSLNPSQGGLAKPPAPGPLRTDEGPGHVTPPAPADRLVVATSQREVQPPVARPGPPAAPAAPPGLPPLQLINEHEVNLEYELSRVGPSGVGGVDLYISLDKGANWKLFAQDPHAKAATAGGKYQRTLELPDGDGVYGLALVVRNQAGIGRAPPKPGDAPEMLIEVDRTPPTAELHAPRPDPQHRDALLLSWAAQDKNLATQPVTIEWAGQREGPWQAVAGGLPGTGTHSWAVPAGTPVRVYLRLRVRDSAGNEAVAATPEPQLVDLTEPEGRLLTVRPARKP